MMFKTIGVSCIYGFSLFVVLLLTFSFLPFLREPLLDTSAVELDKYFTYSFLIPGFDYGEVLTENEASHMRDVGFLFRLSFLLLVVLLPLGLKGFLQLPLAHQGAVVFSPFIFLFSFFHLLVLLVTDFELFFFYFHEVLFPQGNYVFPFDSVLIQTYPGEFFFSMGIVLVVSFLVVSIFLAYLYKRELFRRSKV